MEKVNAKDLAMTGGSLRHFERVIPPAEHAGVGAALRRVFHMNGEARSLKQFEDLLSLLDGKTAGINPRRASRDRG